MLSNSVGPIYPMHPVSRRQNWSGDGALRVCRTRRGCAALTRASQSIWWAQKLHLYAVDTLILIVYGSTYTRQPALSREARRCPEGQAMPGGGSHPSLNFGAAAELPPVRMGRRMRQREETAQWPPTRRTRWIGRGRGGANGMREPVATPQKPFPFLHAAIWPENHYLSHPKTRPSISSHRR